MYNTLATSPNLYRIISTFHPRIIAGAPKIACTSTEELNIHNVFKPPSSSETAAKANLDMISAVSATNSIQSLIQKFFETMKDSDLETILNNDP